MKPNATKSKNHTVPAALIAVCFAASTTQAANYAETEPNDSKATATVVSNLVSGDTLTGSNTGSGEQDYFRLTLAPSAAGIYRHRLTFPGVLNSGIIRGLNLSGGAIGTTDVNFQLAAVPSGSGAINQFYTFGGASTIHYSVTGFSGFGGAYTAAFSSTAVSPQVVSTVFQPGTITLTSVGETGASQTDTEFWVYDSSFNALPGFGNDNASASVGSTLVREFAPGIYYVAVSDRHLANDLISPADDNLRDGKVLDFPGVIAHGSTDPNSGVYASNLNTSFRITDSATTTQSIPVTKTNPLDVNFVQFTVVPEPSTCVLFIVAGGMLALRKRRMA